MIILVASTDIVPVCRLLPSTGLLWNDAFVKSPRTGGANEAGRPWTSLDEALPERTCKLV